VATRRILSDTSAVGGSGTVTRGISRAYVRAEKPLQVSGINHHYAASYGEG